MQKEIQTIIGGIMDVPSYQYVYIKKEPKNFQPSKEKHAFTYSVLLPERLAGNPAVHLRRFTVGLGRLPDEFT